MTLPLPPSKKADTSTSHCAFNVFQPKQAVRLVLLTGSGVFCPFCTGFANAGSLRSRGTAVCAAARVTVSACGRGCGGEAACAARRAAGGLFNVVMVCAQSALCVRAWLMDNIEF